MVWGQEEMDPAAVAFRDLVKRWLKDGKLEH
jgi:hypothetical protein